MNFWNLFKPEAPFNFSAAILRELTRLRASLGEREIVRIALTRIMTETPPELCYHNFEHTLDVLNEALLFAVLDGIEESDCELLVIAAAYHDLGYLTKAQGHEALSAKLAGDEMAEFGYSAEQRALVQAMIQDTELQRQNGKPIFNALSCELSGYLRDADLSNFGRRDFFQQAALVLAEIQRISSEQLNSAELAQFLRDTQPLLAAQRWHSRAAQVLRTAQKQRNAALIDRVCHSLETSAKKRAGANAPALSLKY